METDKRVVLDSESEQRIIQLIRQGRQFEAVREVRKATRLGLAEAKRLADEIGDANPPVRDVFGTPGERAEAAAALAAVGEARAAGFVPIPGWFFPAVGLLVAGVMAVQAISPYWLGLPVLVLVVVAYVVVERTYARRVRRAGVAPRELTLRQQVVLAVPLALLWVAGELFDGRGGWVWLVVAGVAAVWTIGYGIVHNRRARASA